MAFFSTDMVCSDGSITSLLCGIVQDTWLSFHLFGIHSGVIQTNTRNFDKDNRINAEILQPKSFLGCKF